jgi:hypothetical protein
VTPGRLDKTIGSAYAGARKHAAAAAEEGTMMHLLGQALFGLVVGALAKLIMPGQDSGGILITMLLGVVGSMVGTFVGRLGRSGLLRR